jgi:hypothetical protein
MPPARPDTTPPAAETQPAAALPDVTEPSPILPREERTKVVKPKAKSAPEPELSTQSEDAEEPAEPTDYGMVIALFALILVGVAVLASQLPFGRFIAAAIALVGLLGGVATLGTEGQSRLAAGGAVLLHLLVLFVVFFAPSVLSLDPWRRPADTGPQGPQAISHTDQRATPADWVDASNASWQFKDVRVSITAASIGPVELRGPKDARRTTKEQYLQFQVRVTNAGVERQLDLSGWAIEQGIDSIRITDSSGKSLKPASFPTENGWVFERTPSKTLEHVFPTKFSEAKFYFTAPATKTDYVRVQLPGAAVGFPEEMLKFQLRL